MGCRGWVDEIVRVAIASSPAVGVLAGSKSWKLRSPIVTVRPVAEPSSPAIQNVSATPGLH